MMKYKGIEKKGKTNQGQDKVISKSMDITKLYI